jgi:hypothetical protein
MGGASGIEGVLAAIDDFGNYLAGQDLDGTLALLADDPDVTVIPSEGVAAHHGPAAVESFFGLPKRAVALDQSAGLFARIIRPGCPARLASA